MTSTSLPWPRWRRMQAFRLRANVSHGWGVVVSVAGARAVQGMLPHTSPGLQGNLLLLHMDSTCAQKALVWTFCKERSAHKCIRGCSGKGLLHAHAGKAARGSLCHIWKLHC